MSNSCRVCNHPDRLAIDRSIVEGMNLAKIAKEFNCSYSSVYAHSLKHITRQLATVMEKKAFLEGDKLMEVIDEIVVTAKEILHRNYKNGKDLIALKAIDSIKGTVQLLSNISAQLHAAKIAELQLAKDSGEDVKAQQEQEYQEKIAILSIEELKVYSRLVNKITNQNADKIISNNRVLEYNCNLKKSD